MGEQTAGDYVTALIAFNGQGQMGSMALAFDQASIVAMAGKVFAPPGPKLDSAGIADLAGEMCNQVLGKTKANFLKLGLKMQMGLPEVVVGADHVVHHKVQSPVIQIAVTHPHANCRLEFCVAAGTEEAIDEKDGKDTVQGVVLF
jgi:CheY-specific phosphatase CheX